MILGHKIRRKNDGTRNSKLGCPMTLNEGVLNSFQFSMTHRKKGAKFMLKNGVIGRSEGGICIEI